MSSLPTKSGSGRWLSPCPRARVRQLLRIGKAVLRIDAAGQQFLQLRATASGADKTTRVAK